MRESSLKAPSAALGELAEQVVYTPTNEDRKLKAAFLALVDGNPLIDPQNLPMKECERILGRKLPNKESPGFAAWFLNKDENRQRLEYLFQLALGAAEDILLNTDPKAQSARVNMVKAVSELAGKMPSRAAAGGQAGESIKELASSIGKMDRQQLQVLLQSGNQRVAIQATGANQPSEKSSEPPISVDNLGSDEVE